MNNPLFVFGGFSPNMSVSLTVRDDMKTSVFDTRQHLFHAEGEARGGGGCGGSSFGSGRTPMNFPQNVIYFTNIFNI